MLKRTIVVTLVFAAAACGSVTANPQSCRDGLCTDQRYPFCDVDGQFQELPDRCISVECNAGEFAGCRDDLAITCNASGNDYDLIECPHGCDADGCNPPPEQIDCTTNAECTNPAPICSAEMTCRGCVLDDECSSRVCELDRGACVAETAVIYASPTGASSGDCTQTAPCTLSRAVTLMVSAGMNKTLRLLPGLYGESFSVTSAATVNVVAVGATIGANNSNLAVKNGATVVFRGGSVRPSGNAKAVDMTTQTGTPRATLTLRDVEITAGQTAFVANANVTLDRVSLHAAVGGASAGAWLIGANTTMNVDRCVVSVMLNAAGAESGKVIRVTNTVFDDAYVNVYGDFGVSFSTFVFKSSNNGQYCDNSASASTANFQNNVFYAANSTALPYVVIPGMCHFANNITYPQQTPIAGNSVADPQLVDIAAKDYHLKATSPALNVAVPSSGLSTTHDFDGVMRPQGGAMDIGAFERTP